MNITIRRALIRIGKSIMASIKLDAPRGPVELAFLFLATAVAVVGAIFLFMPWSNANARATNSPFSSAVRSSAR
jgi:hypothetical protein